MGAIRKLIRSTRDTIHDHVAANRINVELRKPIFSISFDDVPVSACSLGASILEENGIYGTYYISLGLATNITSRHEPRPENKVYFADKNEILKLHNSGHHIACHTYSHMDPSNNKTSQYFNDAYINRKELSSFIPCLSVDHFAYPYGKVTLPIKYKFKNIYKTMRTTTAGINHGTIDTKNLRSNNLYSHKLNKVNLKQLIRNNIEINGWLIFNTHDIEKNHTDWGTSPGDFRWLVGQLLQTDADILTVRDAYRKLEKSKA